MRRCFGELRRTSHRLMIIDNWLSILQIAELGYNIGRKLTGKEGAEKGFRKEVLEGEKGKLML